MAAITPRKDKKGKVISYCIRVSRGYDEHGKKLKPYTMTYKPKEGMSEKQIQKELNRQAVQFEEQCKQGYALDQKQTFSQYAEYVLTTKAASGTKHRTISRYRDLLERINAGIGHIKLGDLRPQHLNQLYTQLRQPDLRKSSSTAFAKPCFAGECKSSGLLKKDIAAESGISYTTLAAMQRGERVSLSAAEAVSNTLGKAVDKLFEIEIDRRPLSEKTIVEHHRLIQMILSQAEKEMLIPYNPATRVINPPKREKAKPSNYFEVEELEQIRDKLKQEHIKWRTITHLLIVTGCRRGEIMGLKWAAIDLDKRKLYIRNNLLYEKDRGIYQDTVKTEDSVRTINLPQETVDLLTEYREWWVQFRKECGSTWNMFIELPDGDGIIHRERADFLFLQERNIEKMGYPMHPDSITDFLDKFSEREGLPHVNPHAFRHTLASVLCLNGIDITTISKWLGHKSVTTTLNIYEHVLEQGKEKIADCVSDVILKKKNA